MNDETVKQYTGGDSFGRGSHAGRRGDNRGGGGARGGRSGQHGRVLT